MATLTLSLPPGQDVVVLNVTGWTDGMWIQRSVAGSSQAVPVAWEANAGADRTGIDLLAPINRSIVYSLMSPQGGVTAAATRIDTGGAEWLTVLPTARRVRCYVEGMPETVYSVPRTVLYAVDSKYPAVVQGVRKRGQAEVSFFTLDTPSHMSMMGAIEQMPLVVLRTSAPNGDGLFWFTVGDIIEERVSPFVSEPARRWRMSVEAAQPLDEVPWEATGLNTWADWMQEVWADLVAVNPDTGRQRTWYDVHWGNANVRVP